MDSTQSLNHIAIIPDGNRRWANAKNLSTIQGHEAGFEALRALLYDCKDDGVNILSFYAFSIENFKRSKQEINNLFALLERVLDDFSKELEKNKIQLRISGSKLGLSEKLIKKLQLVQERCQEGPFILNICFNYSGQEDILQTTKFLMQQYKEKKILLEQVDLEYFTNHLWTKDLPPVDLMIRTSGEYRISNFMLWQCAYAEFFFSNKLWPDFTSEDLRFAIHHFHTRQRRYGK